MKLIQTSVTTGYIDSDSTLYNVRFLTEDFRDKPCTEVLE